ncbi:hypothetical protein ALT785_50071 [Alteromonas infernus]
MSFLSHTVEKNSLGFSAVACLVQQNNKAALNSAPLLFIFNPYS